MPAELAVISSILFLPEYGTAGSPTARYNDELDGESFYSFARRAHFAREFKGHRADEFEPLPEETRKAQPHLGEGHLSVKQSEISVSLMEMHLSRLTNCLYPQDPRAEKSLRAAPERNEFTVCMIASTTLSESMLRKCHEKA